MSIISVREWTWPANISYMLDPHLKLMILENLNMSHTRDVIKMKFKKGRQNV